MPPGAGLVQAQRLAAQRLAAQRLAAQLLSGEPARSPVAVAERLLAIQGQDARGARLAVRSRTAGLTAEDVDRALTADRTLVITWLNRGTLHLVASEDYWWLHPLTAKPQFQTGCRRLLARLGVCAEDADRGVVVVERALADGPLVRAELAERLVAAGLPADGGVALNVMMLASLRGIAVRGPVIGTQHAYVLARDWLGPPPRALDPDLAISRLARRYLAGHGPASDRDLAKWAGLPLGPVRRGLAAIAGELRDRPDGLAELVTAARDDGRLPSARLLGAFDPVLLGWASREFILGSQQGIVTVNGLFRPFALVAGKVAGTWAYTAGQVQISRFGDLPDDVESELAAEARDVQRFLAGSPDSGTAEVGQDPDEAA